MTLLPADYVLIGIAVVAAAFGVFRGFSSILAFAVSAAAASVAGTFGWPFTEAVSTSVWVRALVELVGVLVVFGIVRMVVRKCAHGLLAQPADALFGILVGVLVPAALAVAWAYFGIHTEHSSLVQEIAPYVR